MSKDLTRRTDLTKRTDPASREQQAEDAASRLKRELMAERIFSKAGEKPAAQGNPRALLVLANHRHSPGWDYAKVLQRQMFDAAAGSDLEMKFAFYDSDNRDGVRQYRMTKRWITDPDDMARVIGRAECHCGCYVYIRDALEKAVEENVDRPMRAVIIVGDAFHDGEDGLYEAAIYARQLRRAGTRLFLIQEGDDPITARRLEHLAKLSGCVYFQFDPRTQERQFSEMWAAMSVYAKGGEEAVKATGGQAATLLLEHLKQQPMPIIGERERVRIDRDIKD